MDISPLWHQLSLALSRYCHLKGTAGGRLFVLSLGVIVGVDCGFSGGMCTVSIAGLLLDLPGEVLPPLAHLLIVLLRSHRVCLGERAEAGEWTITHTYREYT